MSNYFNKSRHIQNNFINLAVPTRTLPLQYNKISYFPGIQQIPCEIEKQGIFPCSQIQTCSMPQITKDKQLSDRELLLLYKKAYELAGLEILKRTFEEKI